MSGFFGVASKEDCVLELFYGVDYHSHLGTRRGGMAVHGEDGFDRAIHNIENTPFRTKFDKDVGNMKGNIGIGCISDYEPQPLLFSSKIGSFSLAFVGKVNNYEELLEDLYSRSKTHFQEMTNGTVNVTELIAALICEKDSFAEGIRYVQDLVASAADELRAWVARGAAIYVCGSLEGMSQGVHAALESALAHANSIIATPV